MTDVPRIPTDPDGMADLIEQIDGYLGDGLDCDEVLRRAAEMLRELQRALTDLQDEIE